MKKLAPILAVAIWFLLIQKAKSETAAEPQPSQSYEALEFKKITWSQETNYVSIGLMAGNPRYGGLAMKKVMVVVVFTNNSANSLSFIFPEPPFRFDMNVFDEKGKRIDRTEIGSKIGKPIPAVEQSWDFNQHGQKYDKKRSREFLDAHSVDFIGTINLLEYFKIEKPGKYLVEYEQRFQIAKLQSSGVLWFGFACPKATISIDVH